MHTLTPMKLNEQIIFMRKSVEKARVRLCRRLIRQRKLFQKSKDEKKIRKVNRIIEEIDRCKKICRDDVSKFALINLKSLHDLLGKSKVSVDERVLYKLACQEIVIKNVEEFRIKYPSWQHEVAFLLQRLGLQYKSKRDMKKIMLQQSEAKKVAELSLGMKSENAQDVKTFIKKEIRKVIKKDENFETKMKKLKDKSNESKEISDPILNLPKLELPEPVITKGQAVIKLLRSGDNRDNEYASVSASNMPEINRNVVLQGNARKNISGIDETTRNIVLVKTRDIEKRRKDLQYERRKKRKDTVILDKLENDSSLKEVFKNTTKSLRNQNLHPSWIAKKQEHEALKRLITSCKAKRVVFNDE